MKGRPSSRRAVLGGLLLAATGCGGEAAPRWAVQHGTLDVGADGVEGYQVWEFFARKWQSKHDEKHHICTLVQQVDGDLAGDLDGCLGCVASYTVTLTELESDCAPEVVSGGSYGDMRAMAFGQVADDIAADDPFPGRSLGWYVTWDGQQAQSMGFAWHEDTGERDDPQVVGWAPGERYVLEPAYAWEL